MLLKLLNFAKRPTSRDIFINTTGTYINVFFTAFFALILVRILDPSHYGVLSVLLGIAYVLANILDFGTSATIYSYLPKLHENRASNLYSFIKSTFFYQSIFSFVVIAVLFLTFPLLDAIFFKTHAPASELYLTAISVLFFIWQNFVLNILFAIKRFFKANLYLNLSNLIKTVIIFSFVLSGKVTVGEVIFVFGIIGPLIFFMFVFLEKRPVVITVLKAAVKKEEFRFGYTLTYFVASQFFNVGLRMDLFLLSFFGLRNEVGYYGLAQKIILTVISTVVSITQVLSPGFSHFKSVKDVRQQVKTGFLYLLAPTGLFFLLFITPNQVFTLIFTEKFAQTAAVTKALSLPFILYALGSLPMLFLLYTVKRPKYILISNIVFFTVTTLGCIIFIPKYGVFGPPYAIALALSIAIAIQLVASFYEYRKLR